MRLFEPLRAGAMVIPNRIMVPAMVTHLCRVDGLVNDDVIARYTRYASGGAGVIVVEAMAVHKVKSKPLHGNGGPASEPVSIKTPVPDYMAQ